MPNGNDKFLDIFIDKLIDESGEQIEIPIELLFQFDKYFELDDDDNILLKTTQIESDDGILNVPIIAVSSPGHATKGYWNLNISVEGKTKDYIKNMIFKLIKSASNQSMSDEDYGKMLKQWLEDIESNTES